MERDIDLSSIDVNENISEDDMINNDIRKNANDGSSESSQPIKDDKPLISGNDINIKIQCEIGQIALPLSSMVNCRIGDIIEFTKWPNKVKLTANGTYFAEGILVEVAGMVGVKITNKLSYH